MSSNASRQLVTRKMGSRLVPESEPVAHPDRRDEPANVFCGGRADSSLAGARRPAKRKSPQSHPFQPPQTASPPIRRLAGPGKNWRDASGRSLDRVCAALANGMIAGAFDVRPFFHGFTLGAAIFARGNHASTDGVRALVN